MDPGSCELPSDQLSLQWPYLLHVPRLSSCQLLSKRCVSVRGMALYPSFLHSSTEIWNKVQYRPLDRLTYIVAGTTLQGIVRTTIAQDKLSFSARIK